MRRFLSTTFILLIFLFMAGNAFAQPRSSIRVENVLRKDGKIVKTIRISSSDRDFFCKENPLIPNDPVWEMGELSKKGTFYYLEGRAVVEPETSCLNFEHIRCSRKRDFLFETVECRVSLKVDKPETKMGKYGYLFSLFKPLAAQIARENNVDSRTVDIVMTMAPRILESAESYYRVSKLTGLLGDTKIHYKMTIPGPDFFVNSEGLKSSENISLDTGELLDGSSMELKTRYMPFSGQVKIFLGSVILLGIGALVVFLLGRKKRSRSLDKEERGESRFDY